MPEGQGRRHRLPEARHIQGARRRRAARAAARGEGEGVQQGCGEEDQGGRRRVRAGGLDESAVASTIGKCRAAGAAPQYYVQYTHDFPNIWAQNSKLGLVEGSYSLSQQRVKIKREGARRLKRPHVPNGTHEVTSLTVGGRPRSASKVHRASRTAAIEQSPTRKRQIETPT